MVDGHGGDADLFGHPAHADCLRPFGLKNAEGTLVYLSRCCVLIVHLYAVYHIKYTAYRADGRILSAHKAIASAVDLDFLGFQHADPMKEPLVNNGERVEESQLLRWVPTYHRMSS